MARSRDQLAQPWERHRGREDGGDRSRHVHVFSLKKDNFSSTICQGNMQPGCRRALLLQGDGLQDNVGQQRGSGQAGICPRGETWDLHSGGKGISPDPEGSVFLGVGKKGGKEHWSLCTGLKSQLELLEQGEKSFPRLPRTPWGEGRDGYGHRKAAGDAGNELPPSASLQQIAQPHRRDGSCSETPKIGGTAATHSSASQHPQHRSKGR